MSAAVEAAQPSREFRERLVRLLRQRLRTEDDAEDLAQDLLVRLYRKPELLPEADPTPAWLHRVVANATADYFRRRAAEARALGRFGNEASAESGAEEEGETEQLRRGLATCVEPILATLSPEDREALELTDLQGLSQKEAALRLGLSHSGMKSRVQRARRRFRAALLDCCRIEVDGRGAPLEAERRSSRC